MTNETIQDRIRRLMDEDRGVLDALAPDDVRRDTAPMNELRGTITEVSAQGRWQHGDKKVSLGLQVRIAGEDWELTVDHVQAIDGIVVGNDVTVEGEHPSGRVTLRPDWLGD